MNALSVRAVPVYEDHEDHKQWPLPPNGLSKGASAKQSRERSQQWTDDEANE